ncbi:MAG: hypothetical protein A3K19_05955 [Lentisphaerae bacterium RIFOXYB12_FULL_65_16]|nr:MAG: hypothetical protein A3K18_34555 [Lentisphaerae bacterium RIFOXYA12_64_32]OGV94016.1 MAG: hypothetical protein A3K19_05955 [Lentisphaerae bacterium RIFOXYB12_FULL_65_16]
MTLIDTSAWIEFFRKSGNRDIKARVAAYLELGEAAHCGPVQFELLTGAREAEIADIRTALAFSVRLDFPVDCWDRAAQIEKALRGKGVTVPRDDIFVAAAALHHGVALYADDSHFTLMRDKGPFPLLLR